MSLIGTSFEEQSTQYARYNLSHYYYYINHCLFVGSQRTGKIIGEKVVRYFEERLRSKVSLFEFEL